MDSQVQIKMMDFAEKWTDLDTTEYADPVLAIESRVHNFDKIYKAQCFLKAFLFGYWFG